MIATAAKTCRQCKAEKPVDDFHRDQTKPGGLSPVCKSCACENQRLYRNNNREKVAARKRKYYDTHEQKVKYHNRKYNKANRAKRLISNARDRATKRDLAFDLWDHLEHIKKRIDIGVCEMTGIAFDLDSIRAFNSPSIDRIDPIKGYVYSNIRIIIHGMNCALGNWGEEVLLQMIQAWRAK